MLASKEARAAAQRLSVQLIAVEVRALEDIEPAFGVAVKERAGAVMTLPGGFIGFHRKRFVELRQGIVFRRYTRTRDLSRKAG